MFDPIKWLPFLALALASGCATSSRRNAHLAGNWENPYLKSGPAATNGLPPTPVEPPTEEAPRPPKIEPAEPPAEGWIPLVRWCKEASLHAPIVRAYNPVPAWSVQSSNGTFTLRHGSQVAWWNGVELRLSFAPQTIDHQPYLHALDFKKSFRPLLFGEGAPRFRASPVLVLDPGHGGENPGTQSVNGGHYEKDYTLDWARRIQRLLSTNGWRVVLTRTNDTDLALSNRVSFTESQKADLFISLHFNSAGPSGEESGLETYCLTPSGAPSTLTRGFADEISAHYPNNGFDAQNLQIALRIHKALLQVNGNNDRGVRRARFPGVLRNQKCPAILVEGGYLSNLREARRIAEPAYRQKLAEAVCRALQLSHQPSL